MSVLRCQRSPVVFVSVEGRLPQPPRHCEHPSPILDCGLGPRHYSARHVGTRCPCQALGSPSLEGEWEQELMLGLTSFPGKCATPV